MAQKIGVRFKNTGKVYDFDSGGLPFQKGDYAVVETARGVECGEVVAVADDLSAAGEMRPLRTALRKATDADIERMRENERKKQATLNLCQQRIQAHGLEMKLVDVEFPLDNSKLLFYFTADGRVDFRELVRDLASVFHTRIELRQIGVRDEAKMLGGIAICGRPFCCTQFLDDFQPVSIKMAKEQGLSLNPTKISGSCGRLMCCLKYEEDAYEHLLKITPRVGDTVNTPQGAGVVQDVNLISGKVKVLCPQTVGSQLLQFDREELTPADRSALRPDAEKRGREEAIPVRPRRVRPRPPEGKN